jgi:predicted AAA+ superfamily ATPase
MQLLQESGLAEEEALYVTADHPRVNAIRLYDIAEAFAKLGGQLLVIDEIHKQSGFAADLKAVYDTLSLRVVFTGSSALHLDHAKVDLSRRAVIHNLPCLSLREFVELETGLEFAALDLTTLVQDHAAIAGEIVTRLADRRILRLYRDYLVYGAYPFYREGVADYPVKLIEVVRQMIDSDLAVIYNIDKDHLNKLNRILELICRSPPLELKVTKLAGAAGINIRTLYTYLGYLEKGSLVRAVTSHKSLAKANKLYFDNPNLFSILCDYPQGAIRETFAAAMLGNAGHRLHYPARGDFLVDERYLFEVGAKARILARFPELQTASYSETTKNTGSATKSPCGCSAFCTEPTGPLWFLVIVFQIGDLHPLPFVGFYRRFRPRAKFLKGTVSGLKSGLKPGC